MNRRNSIRLIGGGMLALGGATLTGCSTDMPPAAIAAWAGPRPDEPDLRRWALAHAVLAPSSHNRQPWLVDLREPDVITLYVDRERLLPETDPWFRQIVVSQGTFLELLVIALRQRGVEPAVELFPQGEFAPRALDERPVAHITWRPAERPAPDPLFAQILQRHTAKVAYDTARPVSPRMLAALADALPATPGLRFGGTVDPARLAPLRELCMASARVEVRTPRTALESLRLTRIGPDEIERHRDGISLMDPMVRAVTALGLFDRSKPPAPDSQGAKAAEAMFEDCSRSAMGFVWLTTDTAAHARAGTLRSAEVGAGRAYMRLQLQATALGLQVHPMSQAPQEFAEMKPHYERLHQLVTGKPAEVETVQMFCRIGYCEAQPHAPRRGVDAIIRA